MYQYKARAGRYPNGSNNNLFSDARNWTNGSVPPNNAEIKMLGVNDTLVVDGVYTVDQLVITKAGQYLMPSTAQDTLIITGNGKTQMIQVIQF